MSGADIRHRPVLLAETMGLLRPRDGGIYVDATLGSGGHAREILRLSAPGGRLIGIEWDGDAVERARERLKEFGGRVTCEHAAFTQLPDILEGKGIRSVDGILADLGLSSEQLEDPTRGFSFLRDGPLDMRMDKERALTAARIVNTAPREELERIMKEYGEERWARRIARAVEKERGKEPIETTMRLAGTVRRAVPARFHSLRRDPSTQTFQALRIAVNDELRNLRSFLDRTPDVLAPGGRIAVISFHSLEDRIVKEFMAREEKGCVCPPDIPECRCGRAPRLRVLTRRPAAPSSREVRENPRARSARLRGAEKI